MDNLQNHEMYIYWINKLYSSFFKASIEGQLSNFTIQKQKLTKNNGVRRTTVTRTSNKSATHSVKDECPFCKVYIYIATKVPIFVEDRSNEEKNIHKYYNPLGLPSSLCLSHYSSKL
jgi:hypothetical protein